MSPIHVMYPDAARLEVTRRLHAAGDERRRRLARHRLGLARRRANGGDRSTSW